MLLSRSVRATGTALHRCPSAPFLWLLLVPPEPAWGHAGSACERRVDSDSKRSLKCADVRRCDVTLSRPVLRPVCIDDQRAASADRLPLRRSVAPSLSPSVPVPSAYVPSYKINLLKSSSFTTSSSRSRTYSAVIVHRLLGHVRGVEADRLEDPLQDRVQPAGADVLRPAVHLERDLGHRVDRVVGELDVQALGLQQRDRLLRQRVLRLGAGCGRSRPSSGPAARRGSGTGPAARASGRSACSLWNAPAAMNRMWSVFTGPYLVMTVLPSTIGSRSRCTPCRRHVRAVPLAARLPATLSISSRKTMPDCSTRSIAVRVDLVLVDQLLGLLREQHLARLARRSAAGSRACSGSIFSNMFWNSTSISIAGVAEHADDGRPVLDADLDRPVFQLARPRAARAACRASAGAWPGLRRRRPWRLSRRAGRRAAGSRAGAPRRARSAGSFTGSVISVAHQRDGDVEQVADHRFDVAAVVADLGVLRRLDLDERRADELRQPAGDLGLADAGRADHDDVLGRDVLRASPRAAAAAASGCGWRPRRPAWRRPGRRCTCRVRRRFLEASVASLPAIVGMLAAASTAPNT